MSKVSKVKVYRDKLGEWRWSAIARNGEYVADSAEGYEHRAHVLDMVADMFPDAEVIDTVH